MSDGEETSGRPDDQSVCPNEQRVDQPKVGGGGAYQDVRLAGLVFVADASLHTTNGGFNPGLTAMANAMRVAALVPA